MPENQKIFFGQPYSNINSFSAELETESTAFLGALSAQRTESAPRKAVDLDHFSLW